MKAIDADALLQRWNNLLPRMARDKDGAVPIDFCLAIHEVSASPTLTLDDLRPKGRWIGTGYDGYADGCLVYDLWECSECRAEFGCVGDPPPYEFCPSCGADMRGGGEDA